MSELEPLATVNELRARLDFEISYEEIETVNAVLKDASNLARYYGAPWPDPRSAPPIVKVTVLNACCRYMKLIDGLTLSRAGDETVQWTDMGERTGTVFFTAQEQATLRQAAGKNRSFWSAGVFAWDSRKAREAQSGVPWGDGRGKRFPLSPPPPLLSNGGGQ